MTIWSPETDGPLSYPPVERAVRRRRLSRVSSEDDGVPTVLRLLPEPERRRVLATALRRRYRRNEPVVREGDAGDTFYLLERGHVAIRATTPNGEMVTLTVLGPGQGFGELALVAPHEQRSATVVAIDEVEALAIQGEQFARIRRDHPAVDRLLVELLAQRVRMLNARLLEALYEPAELRVVHRLRDLCELFGPAPVTIPLTQDELATLAGTSRPTVNRVLGHLRDEGIVSLARRRIEVVDRAALVERGTLR